MAISRIKTDGIQDDAVTSPKIADSITLDGAVTLDGTGFVRLPTGTTSQRPSSVAVGQLRYNTTTGRAEYYNGSNQWQQIDVPPGVNSLNPSGAVPNNNSASIVITGTNFLTGATASIISSGGTVTNATTTTINSITQITAVFNTTGLAVGSYTFKVTNAGGQSGELNNGFAVSNSPTWTTGAGNIGKFYSDKTGSTTLVAADADGDSVSFALASGSSLYGGLTLNGTTGVISGNPNPDIAAGGSDVTNTFTVEATDGTTTVNRTFNIIIDEPLGTSTNPATSAKQLYDAGYTSSGNYYINNLFTNNAAAQVYCVMNFNFKGAGTGYHLQKFLPSVLSNFSQVSVSNATATLSTISTTATDATTYNYRYTTNNSGAGAAGVRHLGLSMTDVGQIFIRIDFKANSYGDGSNPIGIGGPEFDTNQSGNVSSSGGTTYAASWSQPSASTVNSGGSYLSHGYLFPSNIASGSGTAQSIQAAYGLGNSQSNAVADLVSSTGHTTMSKSAGDYTVGSSNNLAFKHQGWSDTNNSAQSDCIYWIAAAI